MVREERVVMVAIYARVSTGEQETAQQVRVLEKWCVDRGLRYKVFEETVSGKSVKGRTELERAMALVEGGRADTLLVWSLDRFGRSLVDLIQLLTRLMGKGARFVTYVGGLDIRKDDPGSMLTFQIFGAIAEYERKMISERTKVGLERAKREGKRLGRRKLVLPEREIMEDLEGGLSWSKVMSKYGVSRATLARVRNAWGMGKDCD